MFSAFSVKSWNPINLPGAESSPKSGGTVELCGTWASLHTRTVERGTTEHLGCCPISLCWCFPCCFRGNIPMPYWRVVEQTYLFLSYGVVAVSHNETSFLLSKCRLFITGSAILFCLLVLCCSWFAAGCQCLMLLEQDGIWKIMFPACKDGIILLQ